MANHAAPRSPMRRPRMPRKRTIVVGCLVAGTAILWAIGHAAEQSQAIPAAPTSAPVTVTSELPAPVVTTYATLPPVTATATVGAATATVTLPPSTLVTTLPPATLVSTEVPAPVVVTVTESPDVQTVTRVEAPPMAACTSEDGSDPDQTFPCLWDGATMGNGQGDTYVLTYPL